MSIPPLPEPDCRTDDNIDGEGEDAYSPALVRRIQREAYKAGYAAGWAAAEGSGIIEYPIDV